MRPLVSRVEIADMLGVSKQRVHQLTERPDFLGIGKVWLRDDVEAWATATGRREPTDDEA